MVWSDTIIFQLLTHDYYRDLHVEADRRSAQDQRVLLALSQDSREEVDAIVEAAAAAGGKAESASPTDMGLLYIRAFEDPDGHMFEMVWVDMAAASAT